MRTERASLGMNRIGADAGVNLEGVLICRPDAYVRVLDQVGPRPRRRRGLLYEENGPVGEIPQPRIARSGHHIFLF